MLGDVDVAHDLEAGDHRGLELTGHVHDVVGHAVHAEAHPQAPARGLEVDVRGPLVHGPGQKLVDELHHGGVGRGVGDASG